MDRYLHFFRRRLCRLALGNNPLSTIWQPTEELCRSSTHSRYGWVLTSHSVSFTPVIKPTILIEQHADWVLGPVCSFYRRDLFPLTVSEPRMLGQPARSLLTIPTTLFRFLCVFIWAIFIENQFRRSLVGVRSIYFKKDMKDIRECDEHKMISETEEVENARKTHDTYCYDAI